MKHEKSKEKCDLMDDLEDEGRPRPQSAVGPSPLGFGRPKRQKINPEDLH